MAKTTVEVLRDARALIEDPARWCQGGMAQDAEGHSVDEDSPDACRWCAYGAFLQSVPDTETYDYGWKALSSCARALGHTGVIGLNDTRDHATVMRMFDCAIAKASD